VVDLQDQFLHWKKMASSGKIEIEIFNGQIFELWKVKMDDQLVNKYQWIVVDPGTKPMTMLDED